MKTSKHGVAPALLALSITAACASLPLHAAEIRGASAKNVIPGQYIVKFREDRIQAAGLLANASTMAMDMNRRYGARVEHTINHVFKGAVMVMDLAAAQRLANDPDVEYVEADQVMSIIATQNNPTWGLDRIDQTNLPLSGTYTYPGSSGVHAYIVDTGIRASHNEFSGRMGNGYDAIGDGNGTNDCQGHGTHVAGTVGGTTYGVAKNVTLHAVRVLGCNGSGSNSGVIAGMDWVAANAIKPAVANMSLGGGASQATDDAVARMTNAGITVVVAAGNDNSNACNYSPARAPSAITVGSTTSSDARSSFSNYGSCVDIYAPGSSILSAGISSNTATATLSGTSMASPHVAGAAALYLAQNPNASASSTTSALVNNASSNKISGIPSGVNKLLNTTFLNGGTTPPPPPPPPPPPSGSSETEPNNSTSAANPISDGVTMSGNMGSSSDNDYYKLTLPAGGTLSVTLTPNSSSDYDLYVYNSNGSLIGRSERGTGQVDTVTVTNTGSSAFTRYIRVKYYSGGTGSSNGTYTVRATW
ncbi:S8 family peptidase [Permianibacter aggregans]|uniref:Serine protease n=1 Tax=Permianibacter aggregans TaxID=1510150 RepID=A0A4R6UQ43_9GAMM|nr:S8 family peptidase [Permianibacter aggregans]QGX40047.1 S8 family peptidase [Permianibacter aggregans]TDQ49141.1 serine protease [Permianibacter aggregans]